VVFFLFVSLAFSVDKGMKEYKQNNFDEARKYYESVLEERKDDSAANFGLGVSAYQQGDIKSAMEAFDRILRDDEPELKAKSYYNMGNILYDQQRSEESLAFFKKALELDPADTDAKFNYEILKYHLQPQEQQQNDNDKNSENQEESEQSKQENQSTEKEEDKTQQQSEKGDKGQEKEKSEKNQGEKDKDQGKMAQEEVKEEQEGKGIPEPQKREEDGVNQDRMNAQAILDALKEEEKIHQKRQIARAKSKKLEKDW
jgi:tetratricopeptide (TPR) repeat protein